MDGQEGDYNECIQKFDDGQKTNPKPSFFKLMVGNFQDYLRFPRAFVAGSTFVSGPSIGLIGPSKKRWEVELRKQDEDVLMTKGWCCFAKDHNLSYGHFLLFEQLEARIYKVGIFDASDVEVNDRFSVVHGGGGSCQGLYCLNATNREFNLKYELQMAQIRGVRISEWEYNALKEELQARHMTTWGSKRDLVCRLQLAVVAEKLTANFPDCSDDISIEIDDESSSEIIIISDSEDEPPSM